MFSSRGSASGFGGVNVGEGAVGSMQLCRGRGGSLSKNTSAAEKGTACRKRRLYKLDCAVVRHRRDCVYAADWSHSLWERPRPSVDPLPSIMSQAGTRPQ